MQEVPCSDWTKTLCVKFDSSVQRWSILQDLGASSMHVMNMLGQYLETRFKSVIFSVVWLSYVPNDWAGAGKTLRGHRCRGGWRIGNSREAEVQLSGNTCSEERPIIFQIELAITCTLATPRIKQLQHQTSAKLRTTVADTKKWTSGASPYYYSLT